MAGDGYLAAIAKRLGEDRLFPEAFVVFTAFVLFLCLICLEVKSFFVYLPTESIESVP